MAVEVETLIDLHEDGFKLVPLLSDGKTPNVVGLLTAKEGQKSIEESEDRKEHPVKYIYRHPEFWNKDRIEKEAWRFENVATTFGRTHLKDKDGIDLYLNQLDIDSETVFTCKYSYQ